MTGVLREEGHLDIDDTGESPHDDVTAAASLGAASIGSQPQKLTRVPPRVSDGPAHTWISNFWPPELWKSISFKHASWWCFLIATGEKSYREDRVWGNRGS